MEIFTKEITSIKARGNKVDFLTIEITSKKYVETTCIFRRKKLHQKCTWKRRGFFDQGNYIEKVCGNDVDFSTIEITSKNVCGNDVDLLTIEVTSKKECGNDADFSAIEITSKKSTWK